MTKTTLVASSPTQPGLLALVQKYFYSTSITFDGETVSNSKGPLKNYRVTNKKGRWRFERLNETA